MSIEAGTYRAVAVKGSEQYGQTTNGNDQIVITMDLPDIGEQVSVFLVFSDKAAPHSMKRLRLAGWQGDDLANLDGLGSRECEVVVKYEDWQGQQKMKVEILAGGTVTLANVLDDKGKKAFGAKFKKLAAATAPVSAAPQGKTGTDDIDF